MGRMEKYNEQMLSHPFFAEICDDLQLLNERLPPKMPKSLEEHLHGKPPALSESEYYVVSVFLWTSTLADSFKRLEHIRAYLAYFRLLKQYREIGINRANYIRYHYSNHAVTLLGIFDIALILTNNVFRLGLPERQCRPETVTHNRWVRSRGIDKILQEFDSALEPLRGPRHMSIHRGYPRDSEPLWYLRGFEILRSIDSPLEVDSSSKIISLSEVGTMYKAEILRILDELSEQEKPVFNTCKELLAALHPVYNSWKKFFAAQEK